MRNYCYENDFDLHENETACRTHFHMKGFALRLVLKQRHKRTRKWPIGCKLNLRRDLRRVAKRTLKFPLKYTKVGKKKHFKADFLLCHWLITGKWKSLNMR